MAKDAPASGHTRSPQWHPRTKIEKFLQEELSESQAQRIQQHLARCAACREEAIQRAKILRLGHQSPIDSVPGNITQLGTSPQNDVLAERGVSGWKVVLGVLGLGVCSSVLMLTLWLLGANTNEEIGEATPAENAAHAVMNDIVIPVSQNFKELTYEEIMVARNKGYACPLFTGLGFNLQDATIRHDRMDRVAIEMNMTRGEGENIKVTETRYLYGRKADKSESDSEPLEDPNRYVSVTEAPAKGNVHEDSFQLEIKTPDADYTVTASGVNAVKEHVVTYIAMSDQARIRENNYTTEQIGDRFSRGFTRLIGQD